MARNRIVPYDPRLRKLARELRKNPTPGERVLWSAVKNRQLGVEFHRQVPMDRFIVDFYAHELALAIEVDGSSHADPEFGLRDLARQAALEKLGITVIRFDEEEVVRDVDRVAKAIYAWIHDRPTSP